MVGTLTLAQEHFARGEYAESLRIAQLVTPRSKVESTERGCLICEALQYAGIADEALQLATRGLQDDVSAAHAA